MQAILTGSRGGLLSLVIAGLFAMLLTGVAPPNSVRVAGLGDCRGGLYSARLVVPTELLSRVTFGGGGGTSLEDDPRMRIWKAGLSGWFSNPMLGLGFEGFFTIAEQLTEYRPRPHNTFISVLVELGIVGLVMYLVYVVMLFRSAWRLPRREKWLWIGILLISILNCMTCGSQRDKFTWFIYVMVMVQEAALALPRANDAAISFPAWSRCRSLRRCGPTCESREEKFDAVLYQPAEFHAAHWARAHLRVPYS